MFRIENDPKRQKITAYVDNSVVAWCDYVSRVNAYEGIIVGRKGGFVARHWGTIQEATTEITLVWGGPS